MEHKRGNIKLTAILGFVVLIIGMVWYIGMPKRFDDRGTVKIEIPANVAKTTAKSYDPQKEYFYEEEYVVTKEKTWIPFKFKNDTVYKSGKQFMSKNCDCGS